MLAPDKVSLLNNVLFFTPSFSLVICVIPFIVIPKKKLKKKKEEEESRESVPVLCRPVVCLI